MTLEVAVHARVGTFALDAAFSVDRGITAVFGPSGAGKTLTLRCVAGLLKPTSGRITLGGRTLFDASAGVDLPVRERRIGYVFQQYALFPHLSVGSNIAYGIAHLPRAERDEKVSRLLTLVGLDELGARRPRELSGGQQQRVALARALATDPQLLLLDEPFAAVDLRVRRRLRGELRRIQQATGTPMLLVTHDLQEVRQLADSVVLVDAGKVLCSGATAALLAEPLHSLLAEMTDEKLV